MNILQTVMSVYIICLCECVRVLAYREHWGGKETPCKKLQEDDHHSMVNTWLTDSLRLDGDRKRDTHTNTKGDWLRTNKQSPDPVGQPAAE